MEGGRVVRANPRRRAVVLAEHAVTVHCSFRLSIAQTGPPPDGSWKVAEPLTLVVSMWPLELVSMTTLAGPPDAADDASAGTVAARLPPTIAALARAAIIDLRIICLSASGLSGCVPGWPRDGPWRLRAPGLRSLLA